MPTLEEEIFDEPASRTEFTYTTSTHKHDHPARPRTRPMQRYLLREYQTTTRIPLSPLERDELRRLVPSLTITPSTGEEDEYDLTPSSMVGTVNLGKAQRAPGCRRTCGVAAALRPSAGRATAAVQRPSRAQRVTRPPRGGIPSGLGRSDARRLRPLPTADDPLNVAQWPVPTGRRAGEAHPSVVVVRLCGRRDPRNDIPRRHDKVFEDFAVTARRQALRVPGARLEQGIGARGRQSWTQAY